MTNTEIAVLAYRAGFGDKTENSIRIEDFAKLKKFAEIILGNRPLFEINSSNTVAVDREYYWQPMDTCPRGVKVQLLGAGGVAVYGQYHGKDPWWTHWAPLPVRQKEGDES